MRQVLSLPYEVNPLIKLCRWSLLVAGAIYGFKRNQKLAVEEQEFRIREKERKAEMAQHIEREKIIANAAELAELERIFLAEDANQRNPNGE